MILRSVTLVGEKGRKVLKEAVKEAKCPVKSRLVPQEVVLRYRDRIKHLEKEVKQIMKQEEEEKQVRDTAFLPPSPSLPLFPPPPLSPFFSLSLPSSPSLPSFPSLSLDPPLSPFLPLFSHNHPLLLRIMHCFCAYPACVCVCVCVCV